MTPTLIANVHLSELPPSVNNMFVNKPGGGRFRSKAYKAWLELSGWELVQQRPGNVHGPYAMTVTLGRVNKRRDLSNMLKATEDLLVAHGIVEDDSLAQRIHMEWGAVKGVQIMVCSTKERG